MRVEVLNGVNLDVLGRRDPAMYGGLSLNELESQIYEWGKELGIGVRCRQTNDEGQYIEWLHEMHEIADGVVYVGTTDGAVRGLDLATGDDRWSWQGDPTLSVRVDLVADGVVYANPNDGLLLAISTADGSERWRFLSFTRGVLVPPDSAGWDLAVRRFRVVPAGEAARIDSVRFEDLRDVPPAGYHPTDFRRDTVNPAIERWYRYDWLSHLLRPKPEVYVLRTRTGQAVKLAIVSYYCPGPEPGCVTVRFARLP